MNPPISTHEFEVDYTTETVTIYHGDLNYLYRFNTLEAEQFYRDHFGKVVNKFETEITWLTGLVDFHGKEWLYTFFMMNMKDWKMVDDEGNEFDEVDTELFAYVNQ